MSLGSSPKNGYAGIMKAQESPTCQVCGDTREEIPFVACQSCGTPHHKDCWAFNGQCSVFGCGADSYKNILSTEHMAKLAMGPRPHGLDPEEVKARQRRMETLFTKGLLALFFAIGIFGAGFWGWTTLRARARVLHRKTTDTDRLTQVWKRLGDRAENGDAIAQAHLARAYELGKGIRNAPGQAAYWYQVASDQGLGAARNMLGRMWEDGRGVPQDSERALELIRSAAEMGDVPAQANLGKLLYAKGDEQAAIKWLQKAKDAGNRIAAYHLAVAQKKDPSEWKRLYKKAIYLNSNSSENQPKWVEEAEKLVRELRLKKGLAK